MKRLFLHYYEGDEEAKHLSLLVTVPEDHLEKPATTLRPLFAKLYETARGERPARAGMLKVYDDAGETSRRCGDFEDGAHVYFARPPPVKRPEAALPPPPPPPPLPEGTKSRNDTVVYYDSSDSEDDATPWKQWENRRFGDKRIINGALLRDDGSREVGRWLNDNRFVAQIPPGRMNNQVDGMWVAVFTNEGAGTAFHRGVNHSDVDVLGWRPGLFEYFVADGEEPRPPAYIQQ